MPASAPTSRSLPRSSRTPISRRRIEQCADAQAERNCQGRPERPIFGARISQRICGGRPWIFKVSDMSAFARNRSRTGQASAPAFSGCSSSTRAARASRCAWTTASSACVVSEDGGEGVGFFGWEVADSRHARRLCGAAGAGRRAGCARLARARRRAARQGPDRARRSARQPHRDLPRRRDRQRSVQARPLDLGLPHRAARHGPRGAARQEHQRRGAVLSRRARLPALRLHAAAVQRLFLPRQSAPPLDRLHRDRAQRHAPSDGGAVQPRRCRPVLRPGAAARKAASA